MSSGPVMAVVIQGNGVVQELRRLCGGKIEPKECNVGTIRFEYSNDTIEQANSENRGIENVIHTSTDPIEAEREIKLWFSPDEIIIQDMFPTKFQEIAKLKQRVWA